MIKFFYDTDSEVRYDIAKELGITNDVIRMPYTIKDKEYFADLGESFNAKEFYALVKAGHLPSTASLNPTEYVKYFSPWAEKGVEVFYVSFGTKFSGTFSNLDIAIKELKTKYPKFKFTRYDTKAISMATGLIVIEAAKLIKQGKSVEETCAELDKLTNYINAVFVVDDLKHLKRGGRLSSGEAFFGGILQIKPIIRLTADGKLALASKVQGKNKALITMANEIIDKFDSSKKIPLIIMNADCIDDAKRVESIILNSRPEIEIWHYDVGPVIGAHCGPGTIGLCYPGEERPIINS